MWIHFCLGNINSLGRLTLYDMIQWFDAGLRELGHEVTIGDRLAPNAINLIWENFLPEHAQALRESGATYGIVGTEIPDGVGFNWRREESWTVRWTSFPGVARQASFIWSMVEGSVPDYSRFAPTHYMELGFSEHLVSCEAHWDPEFDFGFYGIVTPYRQEVLDKLTRYFKIHTANKILPPSEMLAFIARCRIGICFRQSPQWPIPSPTRYGRLLHSRRGIAAEYVPVPTRQSSLVPMAPPGADFFAYCRDRMSGSWKSEAEEAYERYRALLPMREIMERALDTTVIKNRRVKRATETRSDDRRLDIPALISSEVVLLSSTRHFNIVSTGRMVIGIDRSLGPINISAILSGDQPRPPGTQFIVDSNLEDLEQKLKDLDHEIDGQEPALIESGYKGFNIVRFRGYKAISLLDGVLDLRVALEEGYRPSLEAGSLGALKHKIDELKPVLLEEGYHGFDLFRYDRIYGVPADGRAPDFERIVAGQVPGLLFGATVEEVKSVIAAHAPKRTSTAS